MMYARCLLSSVQPVRELGMFSCADVPPQHAAQPLPGPELLQGPPACDVARCLDTSPRGQNLLSCQLQNNFTVIHIMHAMPQLREEYFLDRPLYIVLDLTNKTVL